MPSYRAGVNASQGRPASSCASSWVNGRPLGVGTTRVGTSPSGPWPSTASRASPHGSGFITMPGPPPYGLSSTVRCTSCVQSRRSWTCTSSWPRARALPTSEMFSGSRYSGKIDTTSIRIPSRTEGRSDDTADDSADDSADTPTGSPASAVTAAAPSSVLNAIPPRHRRRQQRRHRHRPRRRHQRRHQQHRHQCRHRPRPRPGPGRSARPAGRSPRAGSPGRWSARSG